MKFAQINTTHVECGIGPGCQQENADKSVLFREINRPDLGISQIAQIRMGHLFSLTIQCSMGLSAVFQNSAVQRRSDGERRMVSYPHRKQLRSVELCYA